MDKICGTCNPDLIIREIATRDAKIALCDMVNQFAYGDEKTIYDGGLSALENAFTELGIEKRSYPRKRLLKMWTDMEKERDALMDELSKCE